ncbi:MAG: DUF4494 domain-containing protein [Petrimonas sp.]|nr:DUF4494 domain-containing protein [Petrimonas sp.]MEA5061837.1 DUF4494 domain-containing protein [Petrimonas sp.]
MHNWFECKVRYDKTQETGVVKTVTEPYLIDALSFTEAEERIVKEMEPFIGGVFSVSDIRRKKFAETILNENGDRYYNARLAFITLDEKSGSEKRTAVNMLVQASSLREAMDIVEGEMAQTMVDYQFMAISETAIMDIFPYSAEEKED